MKRLRVTAGVLMVAAIHGLFAAPPAPPEELSLPARLRAHLTILRGPIDGRTAGTTKAVGDLLGIVANPASPEGGAEPATSAVVSINIRRWTLEDERQALVAAFQAGRTAALVKEMDRCSLGELHLNSELRLPIRVAITWITPTAQHVRLALNRRVVPSSPANPFAQYNQVIDIVEFSLPHGEPFGTGTVVTATEVELQEPGLMALVVPEIGSATQPLTHVERQPARPR